ncbi:MAG: hypothetical protein K0Q91_2333 [Fibrobacteria bacterium]|nr:hypothetical protein [Fibrobacteria bacterium]
MTSPEKSAVVFGATGAVGGQVLAALSASPAIERITTLGRRAVPGAASAKLEQHVIDPGKPASYESRLPGHAIAICTFGVGEASKLSREEFRRIDFDYVLDFARACRRQGVSHFSLLVSVGANPRSRIFYLRSKGELEAAVAALGFDRVSFFRPSMILTPKNRYGLSQAIVLKVWPVVDKLFFGPLRRYRGISIADLGRAMVRNALVKKTGPGRGVEILMWPDFKRLP